MSYHGANGEDLVACQPPGGNHIETAIVFGIAKDDLLATATIMKQNLLCGAPHNVPRAFSFTPLPVLPKPTKNR
jgi:hypothetical protein